MCLDYFQGPHIMEMRAADYFQIIYFGQLMKAIIDRDW